MLSGSAGTAGFSDPILYKDDELSVGNFVAGFFFSITLHSKNFNLVWWANDSVTVVTWFGLALSALVRSLEDTFQWCVAAGLDGIEIGICVPVIKGITKNCHVNLKLNKFY